MAVLGVGGTVAWEMPSGGRRRRVAEAESPFPGDCSPVPFCCPLGTGTALHFPSCARAPAPASYRAWGPLDEIVATVLQEGRGSFHWPGSLQVAQHRCSTLGPTVAERERSIQPSCRQEREAQPACARSPSHSVKELSIGFVSLSVSFLVCYVLLEMGALGLCTVFEIWVQYVLNCWRKGVRILCSISFLLISNHLLAPSSTKFLWNFTSL